MPQVVQRVDLQRPPEDQDTPPHNRWHPEIPPVASVRPGSAIRVECLDSTGGQIINDDSAADVGALDLRQVHYLAGPVDVEGAEPGDLLAVEILDIGPFPGAEWGYSVILDDGPSLLGDLFAGPRKAVWDIDGVYATSRHIRDVRIPGLPHPGVAGCAPSTETLRRWNEREATVEPRDEPWSANAALGPEPRGALLGGLHSGDRDRVAAEAARTWAAREQGGNMDVKELTRGAVGYFPVYVPGGRFSVGDLQFSQGDGKIAGFGGLKMAGWIDLRFGLVKAGVERWGIEAPVIHSSPHQPSRGPEMSFLGVSVERNGEQRYLDFFSAYRRASLSAIAHLRRLGYSEEQAFLILTVAPVDGRVSCLLQHPNVCVTMTLARDLFQRRPGEPLFPHDGPLEGMERGELATP